jgi:mannosyltransferase OCH1-like enzyme
MTIPAILHQTWKSAQLPGDLERYRASWKALNPALDHRFYDDAACLQFVCAEFPQYVGLYRSLPFAIQRADLFRYLAVYRHGGIYADVDMECLRPIARFLACPGALFSVEAQLTARRQRELGYARPYQIANCMFAAPPRHPFLRAIIERAAALCAQPISSPAEVEDTTGPRMLTRLFYETQPANVFVLHQIFWLPSNHYPGVFPLNRNIYARHHFRGSWKDEALSLKSLRRRWIERDILPNPFPRGLFHSRPTR